MSVSAGTIPIFATTANHGSVAIDFVGGEGAGREGARVGNTGDGRACCTTATSIGSEASRRGTSICQREGAGHGLARCERMMFFCFLRRRKKYCRIQSSGSGCMYRAARSGPAESIRPVCRHLVVTLSFAHVILGLHGQKRQSNAKIHFYFAPGSFWTQMCLKFVCFVCVDSFSFQI